MWRRCAGRIPGGWPWAQDPTGAALAYKAMEQLDGGAEADLAARTAAEELSFAGNMRASAEYRQALCQTLCARVLREVEK